VKPWAENHGWPDIGFWPSLVIWSLAALALLWALGELALGLWIDRALERQGAGRLARRLAPRGGTARAALLLAEPERSVALARVRLLRHGLRAILGLSALALLVGLALGWDSWGSARGGG
jgi:hypothetical protein